MTDQEVKVVVGSLLHDIGKVIYRQGDDHRNHSKSGYDYLKDDVGIGDNEILNCVRFHHGAALKNAMIPDNALAYITYIADNIAAATDRRKKEETESGFELSTPLQSIFNILNENTQEYYFCPGDLNPEEPMNFPGKEKEKFSEFQYKKIRDHITENLKGFAWTSEYVNSLLAVMEANLTYIPSSTSKGELADISLYDHVKLTAAMASCIYQVLQDESNKNYRECLFEKSQEFYKREVFLICSLDISGIQDFIYTIATKNALKTLRARSFYLEILMEHLIDCLLEKLHLSRANLLYAGGGHCYLLLPNTNFVKDTIEMYLKEVNRWFMDNFQIALYVAGGYAKCSSDDLKDVSNGNYTELYKKVGKGISARKAHRYEASDIRYLNERKIKDYSRECKVCRNIGQTDEEGVCTVCRKIERLSKNVLDSEFFTILMEGKEDGLGLPGGYAMVAEDKKEVQRRMEKDPYFVRTYAKNYLYIGKHISTKLWVGDYKDEKRKTFEELAEAARGIKRIGILRADVDNLGSTFVNGFNSKKTGNRYATISRTATLSRELSLFFKYYINDILKHGQYDLNGEVKTNARKATIIYAGGDDVFVAGAWDEVIEFAIDLRKNFEKYTQGTLTLSAGIGIYEASYPVRAIAGETGEMEDRSKRLPGKNAVTIFEDGVFHEIAGKDEKISDGTYSWKEFEQEVIEEKYRTIRAFLETSEDRGMSFLYHVLELIRNRKEKVNFTRFIYLLARLEPTDGKEEYKKFSEKMMKWIQSEKDCRQLKTAINLYSYMERDRKVEGQ